MQIEQVRVENYKSILDSGWVDIEDNITTLVGANEAGKTNFLEVLSKFKTGEEIPEEDLSRYKIDQSKEKSDIPIVSVRISGLPRPFFDAVHFLSDESQKFTTSGIVEVSRYANGRIRLSDDYLTRYFGPHNVKNTDENIEEHFTEYLRDRITAFRDFSKVTKKIEGMIHNPDSFDSGDLDGYIEIINEEIGENVPEQAVLDTKSDKYRQLVELRSLLRAISQTRRARTLFSDETTVLPDFQLFKEIHPIAEGVEHDELEPGDPYFELLSSFDINPTSLKGDVLREAIIKREDANRRITSRFNDNWDQSNVRFRLTSIGDRVTIRIYESEKRNDREIRTLPSERSQGFRWYLAFFCHLIARGDGEITNSVILLDDPGAYLHPEGHKDLKGALAELADDNQVIYSTHSPYMIDKNNLNSVRTVRHNRGDESEDKESPLESEEKASTEETEEDQLGTVVERLSRTDSPADDSLASVRMALGASFSDSLFTSKYTILVEGHDDRMYLEAMSNLLEEQGRATLRDEAVILDCGGASKVDYLARIVNSEEYNFAVLLDDDKAGRKAEKSLRKSSIGTQYINLVSDVMGSLEEGEERTIEDLFTDELFCEVAAEIHEDDGVDKEDLKAAHNPPSDGIVEVLDGRLKGAREIGQDSDFYEDKGDDESSEPDILRKVEIAHEINNRIVKGEYDADRLSDGLDRFEELIEKINTSLEASEEQEESDNAGMPTAND